VDYEVKWGQLRFEQSAANQPSAWKGGDKGFKKCTPPSQD